MAKISKLVVATVMGVSVLAVVSPASAAKMTRQQAVSACIAEAQAQGQGTGTEDAMRARTAIYTSCMKKHGFKA